MEYILNLLKLKHQRFKSLTNNLIDFFILILNLILYIYKVIKIFKNV